MRIKPAFLRNLLFATCLAVTHRVAGQGSLTPSGAPVPTMLSLNQIQPRTPILSLPYTISTGGSYYLAGNLIGVSGQHGITINANNVTLDLNGFSLTGVAGSLNGINVSATCFSLSLYNGGVTGWGGSGVSASNAVASQFENLRLLNNAAEGLIVGSNSIATRCLATGNTGSGIRVEGSGNRIEDNQSPANKAWGFRVDAAGNLIIKNSAAANGSYDYLIATNNSYGQLVLLPAGTITNSTAWANFYTVGCTPTNCAGQGAFCGTIADGCGGTLSCGTCTAPQVCDVNQCCTIKNCSQQGFNCGFASDTCGGSISCGICPAGQNCTANVCVAACVPITTCPVGDNCGTIPNGCGGTVNCGTCTAPQTCSGNVCVTTCVPATTCPAGDNCGTIPNGCGGTVNCGTCTAPQTCSANVCH